MTDIYRPGGWVDGIGWVALASDLRHRDWFTEGIGGREFMRGLGEMWPGCVVIVTRWADGTIPGSPEGIVAVPERCLNAIYDALVTFNTNAVVHAASDLLSAAAEFN